MCDHHWVVASLYPTWIPSALLHNSTIPDSLGSLVAVLAFAAFLYAPGYIAAHTTNLFNFRTLPLVERSLWAIASSFCIAPIVAHLLGCLLGLSALSWLFALTTLPTMVLLARVPQKSWPARAARNTIIAIVLGWTTLALLLLIDLQIGHKLYFSVTMADGSYRIAFTNAVLRTGIPPANPLYFAGAPAPMRYYYFWYILCAAVARLAHVPARDAFYASCIWAGFGLVTTVQLYTRHFFRWSRKQRSIALGLLLITGADLLPALGQALLQPTLNGDTEWWSVDPIDAWPDSLLWVPHHVASVLCCVLGFLFLWRTLQRAADSGTTLSSPEPAGRGEDSHLLPARSVLSASTFSSRTLPLLLAATAFASAAGLSAYVAFGFALLMAAWLLRLAILRDPTLTTWLRHLAAAAGASAVLLFPFLHELAAGLQTASTSQPPGLGSPAQPHLFVLSVRRMIDSELLTGLPVFARLHQTHPLLLDQSIRLVLLIPGLFMELGLYGAVLVLLLLAKRRKQFPPDPARDTAIFFTLVGLLMSMVLSSSVITNNDFGFRAVMLPQFFLTLLTADLLASWRLPNSSPVIPPTPATRRLVHTLLVLGAMSTIYWAFLLRAWLPFAVAHRPISPQLNYVTLPEDNFQVREAFRILDRVAPANAVVAFRPIDPVADRRQAVMVPSEYYQRALVMDSGHQMLNAEGKCAVHFGGNPAPCHSIQRATAQLYASPAPDATFARNYCTRFGVHYLVLSAWDPLWTTLSGWPVTLPTIAQQPRLRVLDCRPASR